MSVATGPLKKEEQDLPWLQRKAPAQLAAIVKRIHELEGTYSLIAERGGQPCAAWATLFAVLAPGKDLLVRPMRNAGAYMGYWLRSLSAMVSRTDHLFSRSFRVRLRHGQEVAHCALMMQSTGPDVCADNSQGKGAEAIKFVPSRHMAKLLLQPGFLANLQESAELMSCPPDEMNGGDGIAAMMYSALRTDQLVSAISGADH